MGYHPRQECCETGTLITTRTRNSELWFVNNPKLEKATLAYTAKYAARYNVSLYALAIEGNHKHYCAQFPEMNRSAFMREVNACVARAANRLTPEYPGGTFWGRRFSAEQLPDPQDIENWFFYVVLQPVQDGMVPKISEYPFYNCFNDAIRGIKRKFKLVNWTSLYEARRKDPNAPISDHMETYVLEFQRLPGYEDMPKKEYIKMMARKLRERTAAIVEERRKKGLGFVGREKLLQAVRGARPKHTKTSDLYSHRPRVLCIDKKRRVEYRRNYFEKFFLYKECSRQYREGKYWMEFPEGMYPPPIQYSIPRPPPELIH